MEVVHAMKCGGQNTEKSIPIDKQQSRSTTDVPTPSQVIHFLCCLFRSAIRSISGVVHRWECKITLALVILRCLQARDNTRVTSWSTAVEKDQLAASVSRQSIQVYSRVIPHHWLVTLHPYPLHSQLLINHAIGTFVCVERTRGVIRIVTLHVHTVTPL